MKQGAPQEKIENTGKWRSYPAYNDSSVEWLGDVPKGWQLERLRFNIRINPTKAEVKNTPSNTMVSFVPMEAVCEYGGLDLEQTKSLDEVKDGYTYFRDGDVLVAKITPCFENGKGSIVEGLENTIGFGTTELHVLRPQQKINQKYLFYLTISHAFRQIGKSYMYGAGGQKRVPEDFIRNLRHPIPHIDEQQAIAAFLDHETERIDALIEKKQQQIELLQEKRTALISHAVTKGLDPNARMKDSGIEWLGEIPEHWDSCPLKYKTLFINGAPFKPSDWQDSGVPIIRIENLNGGENFNCSGETLPAKYHVQKGDLLFGWSGNRGTSFGPFLWWREERHYLNQHIFRFAEYKCHKMWLYWTLKALTFYVEKQAHGIIGLVHITKGDLGAIKIPVMPSSEQQAIAAFIDRETARIDALIEKVQNSIEMLSEYRIALISAAVTGKIDVRKEVA